MIKLGRKERAQRENYSPLKNEPFNNEEDEEEILEK
jgi:hypothetical protein